MYEFEFRLISNPGKSKELSNLVHLDQLFVRYTNTLRVRLVASVLGYCINLNLFCYFIFTYYIRLDIPDNYLSMDIHQSIFCTNDLL